MGKILSSKQQKSIDFATLGYNKEQGKIFNWLLLECAKWTVKTSRREDRGQYQLDFEKLKKAIMPDFDSIDLEMEDIVEEWWMEEKKWYSDNSNDFSKKQLEKFLIFRLQEVFFKNHVGNPFSKEKKKVRVPSDEFYKINQNLFEDFLEHSKCLISSQGDFSEIEPIVGLIERLEGVNIEEAVSSANHEVYGKDWKVFKGILFGGVAGVGASMFLGPIIGGAIGNMAGFSGIVATNYGLALLGGGSLASGGLGMAGGSLLVGLGYGVYQGSKKIKNASQDELNNAQARIMLPLTLAMGRIQREKIKDRTIPALIRRTVTERLKEHEKRLERLEMSDNKNDQEKIKTVEQTVELYGKCRRYGRGF